MNVLIIVNDKSGKGASKKCIDKIYKKCLDNDEWVFNILITKSCEELTDYLMKNKDVKYKFIIVAGGDGTIHSLINSEYYSSAPIFHYPSGSGNGFYKSVIVENGIKSLDEYLDIIISGKSVVKQMDLMNINNCKKSFLSVTWGMLSDLDIETEKYRWMGYARFIYGAICNIYNKRIYKGYLRYTMANGLNVSFEGKFVMFLASNLSYITGNSYSSPESKSDDGYIYLSYVLAPISRCELLKIMLNFDSGTYVKDSNVFYIKCKSFDLEIESGKIVVDGELVDDKSINVVMSKDIVNYVSK